jgi:hypothetical protein
VGGRGNGDGKERENGKGREMGRTHEFEDVPPGVEVIAGGFC